MFKTESRKINAFLLALPAVLTFSLSTYSDAAAQTARSKSASPYKSTNRAVSQHPAGAHTVSSGQASSVQITSYLNRLRGKIIQAWLIPDGNNHVTVTGNFNQDGLSDNLKSAGSPHNENAEQAALQAFNACMPLEALPAGMNNGKLTIEFVSNADPHGSSKSSVNLRLDPAPQTRAEASSAAQSASIPASTPASQPPSAAAASSQAAPADIAQPAAATPAVEPAK